MYYKVLLIEDMRNFNLEYIRINALVLYLFVVICVNQSALLKTSPFYFYLTFYDKETHFIEMVYYLRDSLHPRLELQLSQ